MGPGPPGLRGRREAWTPGSEVGSVGPGPPGLRREEGHGAWIPGSEGSRTCSSVLPVCLLTLFPLHAIPALRRQIEATCCLLQNDFLDPGVERHTFLLRGLFIVLPPSPVAYSSPEQYMRS